MTLNGRRNNILVQNRRHFVKTITWRIWGTATTVFIAVIITGDVKIGLLIGPIDAATKVILYYLHEKLWTLSKFGIKKDNS